VPLYDNSTATGNEAKTLVALEDLIAECSAAHSLAEATGSDAEKKAKVLTKTVIGPQDVAWDADDFTEDEMATKFVEFQLFVPMEDSKTVIVEGWDVSSIGDFGMIIRRYVRHSESGDKRDVYLFFLDKIATLENEIGSWLATRNCPRIKTMQRIQGPSFSTREQESQQGEYIFAVYSLNWGDFVSDQ
jgi:hypothetical protein